MYVCMYVYMYACKGIKQMVKLESIKMLHDVYYDAFELFGIVLCECVTMFAHSQSVMHLTVDHCYFVICYFVICHYVIMSLCYYVIMSLCYYVIMLLCCYVSYYGGVQVGASVT